MATKSIKHVEFSSLLATHRIAIQMRGRAHMLLITQTNSNLLSQVDIELPVMVRSFDVLPFNEAFDSFLYDNG